MKKTHFPKESYSVAMSQETGCIVMIAGNDKSRRVVGSLDRDQSLNLAAEVGKWSKGVKISVREAVNGSE